MIITNRRDAGYTVVSRFEEGLRKELEGFLSLKYEDVRSNVPRGALEKVKERIQSENPTDNDLFFENLDFPNLKEIILYNDHFELIVKGKIKKDEFITIMEELYALRCKIAHVKGYFTSIDLDKLIELTDRIAQILELTEFRTFIDIVKTNPNSVVVKIPVDFIEDILDKSGIVNNLPIPDYEYEGGFVGRDEDRKKIIQYLQSDKFPVITITGSGGVGKTSLALRVIQDITETTTTKSFDAIVWSSAKETKLSDLGIEDIEPSLKSYDELLDTIIEIFGFQEITDSDSIEDKEKLCNYIIEATKRILVVIDNLETITDQRIINFIYDAPIKVKFLITSRKGIGQLERRHELKELKAKEAVFLFRQLSKDKQLPKLVSLPDEIIKSYVAKVSFYPLAIKWVIGQVARGKDINRIIDAIHTSDSDISRFCYEQIFSTLSDNCKKILYTLSLLDNTPNSSLLEYVVELQEEVFDDTIEELILVSLVIPEQLQNEKKEISTRYSLLPLTRGYTRLQLNKNLDLREYLKNRINQVESTIATTEKAQREYRHSLYNFGAKSDEEKVATIIAQTAFQKYQTGHYDTAVDDYKRALKVAPNFAPVYRNWAIMEAYENHLTEAEQLMEKAAKLDPSDPQIFLIWGNIYRKSERHLDSHKKYVIAHSLASSDPIILNAFGQAKSRLGYYEDAEKLLNQALKSNFSSLKHEIICGASLAENCINWGDSLFKDRNYNKAEEKYSQAITHCMSVLNSDARDAKIFNSLNKANLKRAQVFLRTNNERKAFDALYAVCDSRPMNFKQGIYKLDALLTLGEIYKKRSSIREIGLILSDIDFEFRNSLVIKHGRIQERISSLKNFISLSTISVHSPIYRNGTKGK